VTFLYRYQEKDGSPREGEIKSASEAEAYSALRKTGIRPMKVWPKPGLLNRLSAIGKRGTAIVVLGAVCLVLGAIVVNFIHQAPATRHQTPNTLTPLPRQQCPEVAVDFRFETERLLALFARPGDSHAVGSDPQRNVSGIAVVIPDFDEALRTPLLAATNDTPDAVTLKRIVVGLKDEARMLRATGKGKSVSQVVDFFLVRQQMEVVYRKGIVESLRKASADGVDHDQLEAANKSLRMVGLKEISEAELQGE